MKEQNAGRYIFSWMKKVQGESQVAKSIKIDEKPEMKDRVLKHIDFRFPVCYEEKEGQEFLSAGNNVECVVLMLRKNT